MFQERIRNYMGRVKEIEDKAKAPKINKDASKRFVRNALWSQVQSKQKPTGTVSQYYSKPIIDRKVFLIL